MPNLRDFLKKKDRIGETGSSSQSGLVVPNITFIRSSTNLEEEIVIPDFPGTTPGSTKTKKTSEGGKEFLGFRNSANAVYTKDPTAISEASSVSEKSDQGSSKTSRELKRLSARLHFRHHGRSRSKSQESSSNLPNDLPEAPETASIPAPSSDAGENQEVKDRREAQWEKRATMLAMSNPLLLEDHVTDNGRTGRSRSPSISDANGDVNIQEAIRLHEEGQLTESTHMFKQLAEPKGANNALAQVLYGLALRHGWGVEIEPENAIHYLSLAASNSASIEEQALTSGKAKGGAAKGELVLAIFELANCFRHGWGVKTDAIAARQYYETAANLGDTDAMEEAAWCYLEGFGGTKDKFKAAQYLRLAENKGRKTVGNSWIWKDKYNPK